MGFALALDDLATTDDIAGLTEAVNQVCGRLNELNAASGDVTRYLELLVRQVKKEIGS